MELQNFVLNSLSGEDQKKILTGYFVGRGKKFLITVSLDHTCFTSIYLERRENEIFYCCNHCFD